MSYVNTMEKILDSKNVTAGGGSASAMAGAMACGLIGMTARLSLMKCYGLEDRQYIELAEELDEISFKLLRGAQDDEKTYGLICDAMKLPKDTDEDREFRERAIQEAGINSCNILKENGYLCKKVLKIGLILKDNSDSNAAADLTVGISLAETAVIGCVDGIRSNLPLIKNPDALAGFREDIEKLKEKDDYFEIVSKGRQH